MAALHPEHQQLSKDIRHWFSHSHPEMDYLMEERPFGLYWNTAEVSVRGVGAGQVGEFLADVKAYYAQRPVLIYVDDREADAALGPALCAAGCEPADTEVFLAHVGPVGTAARRPDLAFEPVTQANLYDFEVARLKGFAESEDEPAVGELYAQFSRRRAEMTRGGGGMLARAGGEAASTVWWYERGGDIIVLFMATRLPFRRQGIGEALLVHAVERAYGRGSRSVMINVLVENSRAYRLYQRLGFTDEIYWRRRYSVRQP